jgi:hypothetical protein
MTLTSIKLKQRAVGPNKAVVSPLLTSRHVLTNSPWTFVGLWLRRNGKSKALFYWEQAEEFYKASVGLPRRSAPDRAEALFGLRTLTLYLQRQSSPFCEEDFCYGQRRSGPSLSVDTPPLTRPGTFPCVRAHQRSRSTRHNLRPAPESPPACRSTLPLKVRVCLQPCQHGTACPWTPR